MSNAVALFFVVRGVRGVTPSNARKYTRDTDWWLRRGYCTEIRTEIARRVPSRALAAGFRIMSLTPSPAVNLPKPGATRRMSVVCAM